MTETFSLSILTLSLAAILARLALGDIRTRRLPDRLTLPLMAAGFGLAALGGPVTVLDAAAGATLGLGSFAALGSYWFRRHGVDGLGLGDAKLAGAAGAWLGWALLPALVLAAAVPALLFALWRRPAGRDLAFGPWLCAAFLGLWILGPVLGRIGHF